MGVRNALAAAPERGSKIYGLCLSNRSENACIYCYDTGHIYINACQK